MQTDLGRKSSSDPLQPDESEGTFEIPRIARWIRVSMRAGFQDHIYVRFA
jgi:hypothetical protein